MAATIYAQPVYAQPFYAQHEQQVEKRHNGETQDHPQQQQNKHEEAKPEQLGRI
jgi:hypothetical protein